MWSFKQSRRQLGTSVRPADGCNTSRALFTSIDNGRASSLRTGPELIRERAGTGLVETALLLPFMVIVIVNAVNLGYAFSVYLNLATAPRQGALYSIQGTSTALETAVPSADAVSSLVYDNINGSVPAAANTPTRICSMALGLSGTGTTQVPNCTNYGSGTGTFSDIQADPEAPYLVLHRVDIQYQMTPLLHGSIFNLLPDSLTLHRTVIMRAMP